MPVVKEGQVARPSGDQRIDVATETHCTVATDTNFDMVPWVEPAGDRNAYDGGQPLHSNADPPPDDEYDSSDEKDSITPEILASVGCAPCSSKVVGLQAGDSMVLTDTPSTSSDVNSDVGSSPAEQNGAASVRDDIDGEGDVDIVELMQREISRLTDKINDLEDENQDLQIHYSELHRSASVACFLEYNQRMELMRISATLTELEAENRVLKDKISAMEKKIEVQLGAISKHGSEGGGGGGPHNKQ